MRTQARAGGTWPGLQEAPKREEQEIVCWSAAPTEATAGRLVAAQSTNRGARKRGEVWLYEEEQHVGGKGLEEGAGDPPEGLSGT